MKERNKDTLKRGLAGLPSYEPAQKVWGGIEQQLGRVQPSVLREQLPTYAPPSEVWNQINRGLEQSNRTSRQQRQTKGMRPGWVVWVVSAAASVMLFCAGYLFANWHSEPTVSLAIRQEQGSDIGAVIVDWNDEEESFRHIMDQLAEIDEPQLNSLRTQLEELTKAKREVENMLREYGWDNRVIRQLAEIETQRSQVYRLVINEL